MKYLFFLFFFVFCFKIEAQILVGSVIDEEDNPLIGVTVVNSNSKKGVVSDRNGKFLIETYSGDYIRLSFIGKKTQVKQIPITKQDTIYMVFVLKEKVSTMREFTVSGKRIKKVAGAKNEYILDYLPLLDGKIVVLKQLKREYYLSIEKIDTVYHKTKIEFDKPKKFIRDCYGNIHLFCKEKIYQLWLTDTIIPLYDFSYKQFNEKLKPLLFCNENQIITENFSNHNKLYQIHKIDVLNKIPTLLHKTYDKEAEKIAAGWYNQIISHYYATISEEMNLIENGVWDGNLISLQTDLKSMQYISWYLKVRARELNIQSFASDRTVYLFDLHLDSITTLSIKGKIISKVSSDINIISLSTKIIHDKHTDEFYYFSDNKSITKLYRINPTTGKSRLIITLKEVKFIKKLKIHAGWLYFLKKQPTGFQKLYRVKLAD